MRSQFGFSYSPPRQRQAHVDPEAIDAFEYCQQGISNCQDLYFIEDTATSILQTDDSNYGIEGYLFMVTNGKVRVMRFFSKALVGPQGSAALRGLVG